MRQVKNIMDLWEMSRVDSKRSGRGRLEIIQDAIMCRKRYNCSINDYLAFGFSMLDKKYREDYLTVHMNYLTSKQINDMRYENKWLAYQALSEFFKRDVIHLIESSDEEVQAFMGKYQSFFAKEPDSFGGKGVKFIEQGEYEGLNGMALAEALREKGLYVLEEPLVQHEALNCFNPSSVNTLRIITITNKKLESIFLPFVLRVGASASKVDNVRSGGYYTLLDNEGKVALDGYYQESYQNDELIVKKHPVTGLEPLGFQIPYFQESIEMIEEMARRVPQVPIVGWDICITPDGPALVEFNAFPSIDFNQNYYFTDILGVESLGAKKRIEEHLNLRIKLEPGFPVEWL